MNLALLKAGDEVLLPDNIYGPNKALVQHQLARWNIGYQLYDPLDAGDLRRKLSSKSKLVWLEAAGSVTLEFPDLLGLVKVCKEAGVLCALDNTWGAGLAFNAFDLAPGLAVNVTVHALTKYPNGGGDVLMGSVVTRDQDLHLALLNCHMHLGLGVGGNDAEAVLRGLPSMPLRYRAHDQVTRQLAQWFQQRAEVVQVLHPALPDSPGHRHWRDLCGDEIGRAAGLFSVVFDPRYTPAQVDAFCDALKLFKIGYSWGGPISLVVPYVLPTMRSLQSSAIKPGTLVRFSIGLEEEGSLRGDLEQALGVAF